MARLNKPLLIVGILLTLVVALVSVIQFSDWLRLGLLAIFGLLVIAYYYVTSAIANTRKAYFDEALSKRESLENIASPEMNRSMIEATLQENANTLFNNEYKQKLLSLVNARYANELKVPLPNVLDPVYRAWIAYPPQYVSQEEGRVHWRSRVAIIGDGFQMYYDPDIDILRQGDAVTVQLEFDVSWSARVVKSKDLEDLVIENFVLLHCCRE